MISDDPPPHLSGLEPYIDANVYCGPYPFRPLPAVGPEELRTLMSEAGIETAFATPFPALFHARPWSGLAPWIEAFEGDGRVRFWAPVNPAMPGWREDLARAANADGVIGIRLFPRCHGYRLFDRELKTLLETAREIGIPVSLTARLLDDRLVPRMLRVDPPLCLEETGALLKLHPGVRWVLNGFAMPEIRALKRPLLDAPTALVDIGLSKPFEPWWEDLTAMLPPERMVLGTGTPLYYHAGTRLSIRKAEMTAEARRLVLRRNASRLILERRRPVVAPPDAAHGPEGRPREL